MYNDGDSEVTYMYRMKCALTASQFQDRMKYKPEILEFHLVEKDLDHLQRLEWHIKEAKKAGTEVVLHHPMRHNGVFLDIMSVDPSMQRFYHWSTNLLIDICQEHDIKCVIHAHYNGTRSSSLEINKENTREMKEKIAAYDHGKDVLLWENTIEGIFSHQNPYLFEELVKPLSLPLCFDISHSFISTRGNKEQLVQDLSVFDTYIQYFHVVDSFGLEHDSLELGKGSVPWEEVKQYLEGKPFIYEVGLEDLDNCSEMRSSAKYLQTV